MPRTPFAAGQRATEAAERPLSPAIPAAAAPNSSGPTGLPAARAVAPTATDGGCATALDTCLSRAAGHHWRLTNGGTQNCINCKYTNQSWCVNFLYWRQPGTHRLSLFLSPRCPRPPSRLTTRSASDWVSIPRAIGNRVAHARPPRPLPPASIVLAGQRGGEAWLPRRRREVACCTHATTRSGGCTRLHGSQDVPRANTSVR